VKDVPGFFSFRWSRAGSVDGYEDVAVVFKVPGRTDLAALSDVLEDVCKGPFVPDAVLLLHIADDQDVGPALASGAAAHALVRFKGRLPLLRLVVDLRKSSSKPIGAAGSSAKTVAFRSAVATELDKVIEAGLTRVFDPPEIILEAPAGFAFQKPSQQKSSYFIRAEQGLGSSGKISFVALAVWRHLARVHLGLPAALDRVYVDSMGVATVAYALRELYFISHLGTPPQVESFHSYGGIEQVKPVPGRSLCLISASSSMNLHRQWVRDKRVPDRDVLTLVTFAGTPDDQWALHRIAAKLRPHDGEQTAPYDIKIKGENFVPSTEGPRAVLLRKPIHGDDRVVAPFCRLAGFGVFDLFRSASGGDGRRRGLYCDGMTLISTAEFEKWLVEALAQNLKAATRYVIYQEDDASAALASLVALKAKSLTKIPLELVKASTAGRDVARVECGVLIVAAVVGGGAAILSLSRALRGVQTGPRTFLIGMQVADTGEHIQTFDRNIKQSAHRAAIEIVRFGQAAIGSMVEESFSLELSRIYDSAATDVPRVLAIRAERIRGTQKRASSALLPTGVGLDNPLMLRKDFAFWPSRSYEAGPHQAEVTGTIAALLQRARESNDLRSEFRLHTGTLQQVVLDPENFARYDDGVIQAALLRAALPSELDYRGNLAASTYMHDFLCRMSRYVGEERSEAVLEFLTALATGRLRLEDAHLEKVRACFLGVSQGRAKLHSSIRFLLNFAGARRPRRRTPF
jgi:hypothetical protein